MYSGAMHVVAACVSHIDHLAASPHHSTRAPSLRTTFPPRLHLLTLRSIFLLLPLHFHFRVQFWSQPDLNPAWLTDWHHISAPCARNTCLPVAARPWFGNAAATYGESSYVWRGRACCKYFEQSNLGGYLVLRAICFCWSGRIQKQSLYMRSSSVNGNISWAT